MKPSTRTVHVLGVAAAALLALSGCGASGTSGSGATATPSLSEQPPSAPAATASPVPSASGTGSTPAAAPAKIVIKDFKYQGPETVAPGTEVTVTNEDREAHTITADVGDAFDANIQPGTSSFTAPTEPGTYPYHCNFHGNMKGILTVK